MQFAKHIKRNIFNLLSDGRHMPGIDDPIEESLVVAAGQSYEEDDDSHLGAVGGSSPED